MMRKMTGLIIHGVILIQAIGGFCANLSNIIKATDVTGELRYRTYIINDYDFIKAKEGQDNDYNFSAAERVNIKLGIKTDLAQLKVTLRGNEADFVAGKKENKTITLSDIEKKIEIRRAYLQTEKIEVLGVPISLTVGRFKVGTKYREFIFYSTKIDGCTEKIYIEPLSIEIGAFKLKETSENFREPNATTTNTLRDTNLYKLSLSADIPEGKASLYIYDKVKETDKTTFSNVVLGGRAVGSIPQIQGLSYDVELAMQKSLDLDLSVRPVKYADGLGARVKGAYETEIPAGNIRLAAEVIYTSGDKANTPKKNEDFLGVKPSYSPVEYEKTRYTPIAVDILGLRRTVKNLTAVAVNSIYKPAAIEGLRLGLALANYQKTTTNAGEKKNYGNEIDITTEYTVGDNIVLGGLLGYFIPGDVYTSQIPTGKDKAPAFKCILETKLLF